MFPTGLNLICMYISKLISIIKYWSIRLLTMRQNRTAQFTSINVSFSLYIQPNTDEFNQNTELRFSAFCLFVYLLLNSVIYASHFPFHLYIQFQYCFSFGRLNFNYRFIIEFVSSFCAFSINLLSKVWTMFETRAQFTIRKYKF